MKTPSWLVRELKNIGLGKLKFNLESTINPVSECRGTTVYISITNGTWADKAFKVANNRPTDPKHTYRHEVGHVFYEFLHDNYKVGTSKRFTSIFGGIKGSKYNGTKDLIKSRSWQDHEDYVSTYAQAHPWEDFAETFAEYMEAGGFIYVEDSKKVEKKKKYIASLIKKYG